MLNNEASLSNKGLLLAAALGVTLKPLMVEAYMA
jgi:hypothetical protein